jgi:HEPN domain-containing protein
MATSTEILTSLRNEFIQEANSAPITHRLTYLAEIAELKISAEQLELIEIITDFNLEARYPDEKFSFYKKCTKEFTESNLKRIREIKEWLLQQLRKIR